MKKKTSKKVALAALALLAVAPLASCNNDIGFGTLSFSYVAVDSAVAGKGYYHINRWKEYDPEGGTLGNPYVGLEFTTVSGRAYYFYEMGLQYVFTTSYDAAFGPAIE